VRNDRTNRSLSDPKTGTRKMGRPVEEARGKQCPIAGVEAKLQEGRKETQGRTPWPTVVESRNSNQKLGNEG
jgi:hypothetical protein